MHTLGVILVFAGLAACAVSAIVLWRPVLGLETRLDAALTFFAGFALLALGGYVSPVFKAQREAAALARAQAAPVPATREPAQLTRAQKLANIRIAGFSWGTEAFGTVMIANFVIYNDNPVPIKDVEITCIHSTNSGTVIDRNARTVYEIVGKKGFHSVREMNMGFIRSEATRSRCAVTDFVG